MRNIFLITIGFLLILSTEYSKAENFKTLEVESKGINIEINTKLELFHIMAYLSSSKYLNNFDFQYKTDINNFFALSKNDKTVQFVKKFLQNYNAHLSINGQFYDENFKNDSSFMQYLQLDNFGLPNTLTNKTIIIDSLIKAVESFAKISQYDKFIENHQVYYHQKIDEVSQIISGLDMINDFESFWGSKKDNYTIVITMLEQDIHASWFTNYKKSSCVFYLSPKFVIDNDVKFGNSDLTNLKEGKMSAKDYIYYGATHEIGHTFLNPIMDNFTSKVDQIPFKISTSDPNKTIFLCESFLRSLTAYFLINNQYNEFAQMVIQGEKQQGYIYNELIVDLILNYVNNRDKYKQFNEYVPEFLEKLKQKVENN